MKKNFLKPVIFTLILLTSLINCGCKARKVDLSGKVNVVCTIFPLYDWTLQIIGRYFNNTTLSLMAKSNMDIHTFQPSTYDLAQLSTADIFVCVGGESEGWIYEALENVENKDMIVINLTDILSERIEAVQKKSAQKETDEHLWLSIKNAEIAVQKITDALCLLDKENAENYKKDLEAYLVELDGLDFEFQDAVDKSKSKTLIFCDRFPFSWLMEDYGFSYYAPFNGCTLQTEITQEKIDFLTQKLDELNLNAVCKIDGSSDKAARAVIKNSSHKLADIVTLDSMQSTSLRAAFEGKTYASTMRKNLEELKKALD